MFEYAIKILRNEIKDIKKEFTYEKVALFYKDKIIELNQAIKLLKESEDK